MRLFLILLFITTFSYTQSQDLKNTQTLVKRGLISTFDEGDRSVQGSPYLYDEYFPAITSYDNKTLRVKYNMVTDEMEVETNEMEVYALNKNIANLRIKFLKDKTTYQAFDYINDDGIATKGYFVLLSDLDFEIKLLMKQSKKFVDRKPAKSSYQTAELAHYKRERDELYIKIGQQNAIELPSNKKDIATLFPDSEKEVLAFIKKNKIKTRKEEDLIKLVEFLNTL